ncbi:MAG: hypothetical protein P8J33_14975 [Pirellulaceae bacterium]|nr:hypothetical protein [Pirellulaceae bacterium]
MRNFVALTVGALALTCALNSSNAQDFLGSNNPQQETFTYHLELTESMLTDLRSGMELTSMIPAELRNRVTHVNLRMVSKNQPATAPQNQGNDGLFFRNSNNTSQLSPTPQISSGTPNQAVSLPSPQNNANLRPATPTNPTTANSNSLFGVGAQSLPPTPSNSLFGAGNTATNPPQSNSVLTAQNNEFNPNFGGNEQPLGPPMPQTAPPSSNFNQPQLTLPPMNSNGFQPANTQPTNQNFAPAQPTHQNFQPRPPQGSEFDTRANPKSLNGFAPQTANNRQNNSGWIPPATSEKPTFPGNQVAAEQAPQNLNWPNPYQNSQATSPPQINQFAGYNQPRQTNIPGQDIPQVTPLPPRLANQPVNQQAFIPAQDFTTNVTGPPQTQEVQTAIVESPGNAPMRAPVAQLNQFNSFLYFLLLCSIGLNIYLGWISRGFYARYRDLADELRDTFSTVS